MKNYEVKISKTLSTTVKVKAKSAEEAEDIVSQGWLDGEYELKDNYEPWGADFSVKELKRQRSQER